MSELVCKGCGGVMEVDGIPHFTVCECEGCKTQCVIPQVVGHLRLERIVDSSEALTTYFGHNTQYNLDVLVHTVEKESSDYKAGKAAMLEAISRSEAARQGNLLPIVSSGETAIGYYADEPVLDGGAMDVYDPVQTGGFLDVDTILGLMQSVATAMAAAAEHDLHHHGLEPSCVLIPMDGKIKVRGFIPAILEYERDLRDNFESYSGNPQYISPERVLKIPEGEKSDVFAFGVMFYYFATGSYPFHGTTDLETVYSRVSIPKQKAVAAPVPEHWDDSLKELVASKAKLQTPAQNGFERRNPVEPCKLREELPPKIGEILLQALSFKPSTRPSFAEITAAIVSMKAQIEQDKIANLRRAQVRLPSAAEGHCTRTRAIPLMHNLSNEIKSDKSKKRTFIK